MSKQFFTLFIIKFTVRNNILKNGITRFNKYGFPMYLSDNTTRNRGKTPIKFNDEESKELFTHYLKEQIKELHLGRITSLYQLERIPLAENEGERKGEIDLINFFFDTFIDNEVDRVKEILQRQDDSDLILEILDLSTSDSETKNKSKATYRSFFP
ncbi:hypothetical protein ACT453_15395 [Bacillus sp. D-CC]